MRRLLCAGIVCLAAWPAAAQTADESVAVCENLVGLRQLSVHAGEGRAKAIAEVPNQPGCRLVPRKQVGAVERRAMFGGAPYECVSVGSGPCVWLLP